MPETEPKNPVGNETKDEQGVDAVRHVWLLARAQELASPARLANASLNELLRIYVYFLRHEFRAGAAGDEPRVTDLDAVITRIQEELMAAHRLDNARTGQLARLVELMYEEAHAVYGALKRAVTQ